MNTLHNIEFWLAVVFVLIAIATGFGLFARWCAQSPAVRLEQLEKLRVGMNTAEVVAIIGQPREVRPGEEGRQQWIYGALMKRHSLVIDFNAEKRMLSFAHGVPGARPRFTPPPGT